MRELKFRAWDSKKSKMLFIGEFPLYHEEDNGLHSGKEDNSGDWYNLSLMQFTGLKDKNGKEIYEGDILYNDFNAKGIVKFINGMFVVYFVYEESVCSKDNDKMTTRLISVNSITRIIGNIHENPELLNN